MGRVRRYKKFKSCDPFAKKVAKVDDENYDQAPKRSRSHSPSPSRNAPHGNPTKENIIKKPKIHRFDDGMTIDQALQNELESDLKHSRMLYKLSNNGTRDTTHRQRPRIDAKKKDETMRQFKKRIRDEKSKLLFENARATSSTVAKRKSFLKTKKEALKMKKNERFKNRTVQENFGDAFEAKRLVVGLEHTPNSTRPPTFSQVPRGAVKRESASAVTKNGQVDLSMMREKAIQRYKDLKHSRLQALQVKR